MREMAARCTILTTSLGFPGERRPCRGPEQAKKVMLEGKGAPGLFAPRRAAQEAALTSAPAVGAPGKTARSEGCRRRSVNEMGPGRGEQAGRGVERGGGS